jgi:phenylpyruvate tautomerase PptA (4-oxalocrotonate tautomerase family)
VASILKATKPMIVVYVGELPRRSWRMVKEVVNAARN